MIKLQSNQMWKIENFFKDIKFHMGKSVLEGLMGEAWVDNLENPSLAYLLVRHYCFINGDSKSNLAKDALRNLPETCKTIIANSEWYNIIESTYSLCKKGKRFSLKKQFDVFDKERLKQYSNSLNSEYKIKKIDKEIYETIKKCNTEPLDILITDDYLNKGIGVVCFEENEIIGICSSNIIYKDGIEINIKVKQEYRHKGIGTAMASKLILLCLEKGLYPSWDAANTNSLGLAKKLGYNYDSEYITYEIN